MLFDEFYMNYNTQQSPLIAYTDTSSNNPSVFLSEQDSDGNVTKTNNGTFFIAQLGTNFVQLQFERPTQELFLVFSTTNMTTDIILSNMTVNINKYII